jgi:hypothetical protein
MKTILKITAGIILAVVLLGAGCAALLGGAADEAEEDLEAEQAAEASDVAAEVTCGPDAIGFAEATGRVTNSSSKPSNYLITVTFTGADEVQYGEGVASVLDLAPGATAEWETTAAEDWRDGTTCVVSDVERLAS